MECKFTSFCYKIQYSFELIDTLWNVNNSEGSFTISLGIELIDTLWNVNEIRYDLRNLKKMN